MTKAKTKRRRGKQRGSLLFIASLLVASAVLRFGDNAGQAFAKGPEAQALAEKSAQSMSDGAQGSADFEAMLTAFQEREARIEKKEASIRDRMHALKIADEQVSEKLEELAAAEKKLRDTIALAETAAKDDLDKLTRVYETMKPKQAAVLFEEMDPNFAAGFLGRMRPEAAAAIMAGLSPEAAHLYSVVLAGRNANVPKD